MLDGNRSHRLASEYSSTTINMMMMAEIYLLLKIVELPISQRAVIHTIDVYIKGLYITLILTLSHMATVIIAMNITTH